ncbi:hypothetical protein ACB092_05G228100 [Castanea dentata]
MAKKWLKIGMGLCGLFLVGYIVGPPLYFHLSESLSTTAAAAVSTAPVCRPCFCDCSSHPLLSLHEDCMKHEPGKSEEMDMDLLSEELKLREAEAQENQRRVDRALLEAKKRSSQYQKEADKCNMGMETCEGTREKAEAKLAAQKKITAMWELRALIAKEMPHCFICLVPIITVFDHTTLPPLIVHSIPIAAEEISNSKPSSYIS